MFCFGDDDSCDGADYPYPPDQVGLNAGNKSITRFLLDSFLSLEYR
jgi:hypothetical protein